MEKNETTERIISIAKEKGIKLETKTVEIKGKGFKPFSATIQVPDRKDAEALFKAVYSADSLRGLALAKLDTNQRDEYRRKASEKMMSAIKKLSPEQMAKLLAQAEQMVADEAK